MKKLFLLGLLAALSLSFISCNKEVNDEELNDDVYVEEDEEELDRKSNKNKYTFYHVTCEKCGYTIEYKCKRDDNNKWIFGDFYHIEHNDETDNCELTLEYIEHLHKTGNPEKQ